MPFAGDIILATDLDDAVAAVAALQVQKPTDTGRVNNTVTPDPDLVITGLPAGQYYTLIANIVFNGDNTAKKRGGLYVPSGGTFLGTVRAQGTAATTTSGPIITDAQGPASSFGFGCIGTGTNLTALVVGMFYSGVGGSIGWQWAQSVTTAGTPTTVKANSFISLIPVR